MNRRRSRFIASLLGLALLGGGLAWSGTPPDLAAYPWLYRRDDRPLDPAEEVTELIAVGDVMLGRGVAAEPDPLGEAAPWLKAADLALGNLEAVIAAPGVSSPGDGPSPYRLWAAPPAIDQLRTAGFDLLGLANNHAFDLGPAGLSQTVSRLETAGITPLGLGPAAATSPVHADWGEGGLGQAALCRPLTFQPSSGVGFETQTPGPVLCHVGPVDLAFLAFNAVRDPADSPAGNGHYVAGWNEPAAVAAIAAAKAQAQAVIVSIHWGREYELSPSRCSTPGPM